MGDEGESFGQRVRRLRKWRRWTQEYLAAEAGLDQSTVSQVERDYGVRNIATVRRLAGVFGADPEDWARLAGLLPPLPAEVMPPAVPAEEPTGDQGWEPAKLIAWVLQHPDRRFVARLERLAERVPPEAFERIALKLARAQLMNGELALSVAEEFIDLET